MKPIGLICGANRGIGLGLCQKLLRKGWTVIGSHRDGDNQNLNILQEEYQGDFHQVSFDVTKEQEVQKARDQLKAAGFQYIDLLVINAGILCDRSATLMETTGKNLAKGFEVNVIGTMQVLQSFIPMVQNSQRKTVMAMGSRAASLAVTQNQADQYDYRISKCALNMLMKLVSIEYPTVQCIIQHPGWTRTKMGGPEATFEVDEVVARLATIIEDTSSIKSGQFIDNKGQEIPW